MADHVSVTTEIDASPDKVWAMVADLTRMHEWSPENDAATWTEGGTTAEPGATFKGTNSAGTKKWATKGTVVEAAPGRVLSFRITAVGMKVALWSYRIEPTDGGCAVTESWDDERGALITFAGRFVTGVPDRASHNRAGMEATLRNLKAAAEV
ncbi:MAG TPA: SRPBCC family protein [Acidimicrobiales bacterium]